MANSRVDSNRAGRIRLRLKAGSKVKDEDVAFLNDYEKNHVRASASSRKVSYTEEENHAAAEGTGSVASMAAAAIMTRAEGERLDSILTIGVGALKEAVEAYRSMCAALLAERQSDAETHRTLLASVSTHFLARTEAEAELIRREAEAAAAPEGDGIEAAATQMLLRKLMSDGAPESAAANSRKAPKD